jgi:hypothetical protein
MIVIKLRTFRVANSLRAFLAYRSSEFGGLLGKKLTSASVAVGARLLKLKALTVYKIIHNAVDEKPEIARK